jgi:hypothetical protein
MAKKKVIKQIFENMELESSEANANMSGPAKDKAPSTEIPVGDKEKFEERLMNAEIPEKPEFAVESGPAAEKGLIPPTGELPSVLPPEPETEEDDPDDVLEAVRRSLLEEEALEEEKDQKWWRRLGRSSRRKSAEEETPQVQEEINLPALNAMQLVEQEAGTPAKLESDEYQDQLDELIDMLDTEDEPADQESSVIPYGKEIQREPEPEAEPKKTIDIEELKKQAFQARPVDAENENSTEMRSIAFEGEEEVFVEVYAKSPDQLDERLSAVENALKPYQRYINFAFAFLGIVMAAVAVFLIYNAYQRSVAKAAPTEIPSDVPYPTTVALPGGWQFALGKGALTSDGSWNPAGAEWLQGTEVCRWVALPWSRQLEAVIRTLNPKDPIQLGMSNNDKLTYNVYSVRQLSPAEMRELDSNSPCLLLVLAEPDAEKRWVLTALP